MQQKYIWVLGIVIVLIVAGFIWKSSPPRADNTITVGVIAPLTGPLAEYGEAVRNGFTLASEDLAQQQGAKKIKFVFEDSAYQPLKAVAAYKKLTEFDHVDTVINWGAPTSEALVPVAQGNSTPFFPIAIVNQFSSQNEVVRLIDQPKDFIDVLWPYIRSKGWKKIGVVKSKNQFLDGMYESLVKGKNADETVILVDEFQGGDKDFRTSIQKAKGMQLDAIGDFLLSGQVSQYEKQSRELGLNLPVVGTDFFDGEKEIAAASGAMEGAVYPHFQVSPAFKARYEQRFGNVSQLGFAGNAYDIGTIFGTRVNYASSQTIRDSVRSIARYTGVLGNYDYREAANDRYLYQPTVLMIVKDGMPQEL